MAFILAMVDATLEGIAARVVKAIITLPLSFVACWFLDITGFLLAVSGTATAFLSLVATLLVQRITTPAVQQVINRRW